MARVEIVGLTPDLEPVLSTVHRLGVLEVTPLAPPHPLEVPSMRPASPNREQGSRIESGIARLGALLELLPTASSAAPHLMNRVASQSTSEILREATALLATLEPLIHRMTSQQSALKGDLETLRHYREIMERLLPLAESFVPLEGFESVALIIQPSYRFVVETLREQVAALTQQQCEVVATQSPDGNIALLLVFHRRFAPKVYQLLQSEQLTDVRLPPEYQGRSFQEALEEIDRRHQEIPGEIDAVRLQLEETLFPYVDQLSVWRTALLDRLDELTVVSHCLASDHAFVLGGWVPRRDLPDLERVLARGFAGRVVVESLPVGQDDWEQMPVLLDNPRPVRPFEVLLSLLPPPRYGTIDPTVFVAFFFPFFFGLILGDIGYGLIFLAAALWIQKREIGPPWLRQGAQVISMGALAAIAFGLAFGEFFGDLGHRFGLRPLVIDRAEAIQPLLLFSVSLGAVQVSLGLVLGVVNGYLERHYKEALSRAATLIGLLAVFVLVGVMADLLPDGLLAPGLVLLAIATALLVYSVGLVGPLELFGTLGNILSYTRLIAVGLASLILARVANELAGLTGSILLGAIVAVLFHGLNLALGLFSPSIHSLRLQYVEFFGRFFQPGGQPFRPFRSRLASLTQ